MVGIANYKGFIAADTSKSLEDLFLYSQRAKPQIEWVRCVSTGCPVLPRVRNAIIAKAMAENCDGVLFVDDDIGFDAKDVYRMIGHGYGLVGAVPQRRNHKWNDPPSLAVAPPGLKVNRELGLAVPPEPKLPMALTFISMQVINDIREAGLAPPYVYVPSGEPAQPYMAQYFGYELVPAPEWSAEFALGKKLGIETPMCDDGEDHYFCRRADKVGYESVIDIEVELRHWEGQVLHDYSLKKFFAEHPEVLLPSDPQAGPLADAEAA
jgi:hypothetical protein